MKLKKLLEQQLTKGKSPVAYASMMCISEVYLKEAVKSATGLSAGEYIRSRAMIHARRQLTYSSLSAKEIAYSLGYNDYAYFSRLFKKHVGNSPSEYRKNLADGFVHSPLGGVHGKIGFPDGYCGNRPCGPEHKTTFDKHKSRL